MRVVLRDVPDAQEPVQNAARLVAVNKAGLGVSDRKVPVGAAVGLVDLDVGGAVHGLQAHLPLLDLSDVHVVAVGVPVPRLLPELDVVEDRGAHLPVAAARVLVAPERGELVPDRHARGPPEGRARGQLREHEEVELSPQLAMVPRSRLLQPLQVRVQVLLREERSAVDPGEHLAVLVAAPVGPGHRQQLEGLHPLGARAVGAAAEVGERPVAVERHGLHALVADQVLDQLDLVGLVLLHEALQCLTGADVAALECLVGLDVAAHRLLDPRQVRLADGDAVRELEVVVEAVLDRRTDRDLGARVELDHRGREHVRRVVADQVERLGALRGDDVERRVGLDRRAQIAHLAVLAEGERGTRESLADRPRRVRAGRAVLELERASVGQRDLHGAEVSVRPDAWAIAPSVSGRT